MTIQTQTLKENMTWIVEIALDDAAPSYSDKDYSEDAMEVVNALLNATCTTLKDGLHSLLETVDEISEIRCQDKGGESARNFYEKYADQLGGWSGIKSFKIALAYTIEREVNLVGGWGMLACTWDELIAQVVAETFRNIESFFDMPTYEFYMKQYIHFLVQKAGK